MYYLRIIQKIRHDLTVDELKKLVHALISITKSIIAMRILYGVKSTTLTKLQTVQSEAAKIVCGTSVFFFCSIFEELHWLKVKERIVYIKCCHSFII